MWHDFDARSTFEMIEDKNLVYDWDEVCSNEKEFRE